MENFFFWLDSLLVVPTIIKLREQAEQIKKKEVEKALRRIKRRNDLNAPLYLQIHLPDAVLYQRYDWRQLHREFRCCWLLSAATVVAL